MGRGSDGPMINERKRTEGSREMSRNGRIVTVMIAVLVLGAVIAGAQATSYEVKKGTVVQVYGNHSSSRWLMGNTRTSMSPKASCST